MRRNRLHILMPVYEPRAHHLREAMESVLSQTDDTWQLLVQDDASTTDVRALLATWIQDPRVTFRRNKVRRGIAGNWNTCLQGLESPYVQFLFQDDTWHPTYLRRCIDVLEKDATLVCTSAGHDYTSDDGSSLAPYEEVLKQRKEQMTEGKKEGGAFLHKWIGAGLWPNIVGEPSFVMMRREAIEKAGNFANDVPQLLDTEYWTRLLQIGNMYAISDTLGTFRVHAQSTSMQNKASGRGMIDRLACLQKLSKNMKGKEEREWVRQNMEKQADLMIKKFFAKTKNKKNVMRGGNTIPISCYPLLMRAVMRIARKKICR